MDKKNKLVERKAFVNSVGSAGVNLKKINAVGTNDIQNRTLFRHLIVLVHLYGTV